MGTPRLLRAPGLQRLGCSSSRAGCTAQLLCCAWLTAALFARTSHEFLAMRSLALVGAFVADVKIDLYFRVIFCPMYITYTGLPCRTGQEKCIRNAIVRTLPCQVHCRS